MSELNDRKIGLFSSRRSSLIFPALLLLTLFALSSCRKAFKVPTEMRVDTAGAPHIRVLLEDNSERVTISPAGELIMVRDAASGKAVAGIPAGEFWDVVLFGKDKEIRLSTPDGRVSQPHPAGLRIEPSVSAQAVMVGKRAFRGQVTVRPNDRGGLSVINSVPLEDYIVSVVTAEMGALDERRIEALKAQAVASRTYAMARMIENRDRAYDLRSDTRDQVYKGVSNETTLALRAVVETSGECLTWKGKPISAFYHSNSGGRTADISEVWDNGSGNGIPYIKSVDDKDYGKKNRWWDWKAEWTRAQLLEQLKTYLPAELNMSSAEIGEPSDIEVADKGPSGRVTLLKVSTNKRTLQVPGDRIRRVLRQPDGSMLPSTLFELKVERVGSGAVIIANGKGFGHGLGMSQAGAMERAEDGQSYRKILEHYYSNVNLTRMY